MKVEIKPRAARQIREATRWLLANLGHEAAARLVDELELTLLRVQRQPGLGPPVMNARTRRARRILLPTESYHVYNRINERRGLVEVLAIRHTRRGRRPPHPLPDRRPPR